jgi:hypothetical protein
MTICGFHLVLRPVATAVGPDRELRQATYVQMPWDETRIDSARRSQRPAATGVGD